jgi:TRAP-type C4-dicarboxylate transport system permease small subunit
MKSVKNTIDKILQWLCVVIVALMTFFVTYQVVTRYVFNKPSAVSETIARYLFVWLTIFGGAYVFGKRGHMNLVFIREKFSLKTQTVLEILSEFLIAVFAILIMIYGGRIYTAKQMVQIDPSLMFSMAWIYGCLPVGGVLVLFYSIYNELELLKKLKS